MLNNLVNEEESETNLRNYAHLLKHIKASNSSDGATVSKSRTNGTKVKLKLKGTNDKVSPETQIEQQKSSVDIGDNVSSSSAHHYHHQLYSLDKLMSEIIERNLEKIVKCKSLFGVVGDDNSSLANNNSSEETKNNVANNKPPPQSLFNFSSAHLKNVLFITDSTSTRIRDVKLNMAENKSPTVHNHQHHHHRTIIVHQQEGIVKTNIGQSCGTKQQLPPSSKIIETKHLDPEEAPREVKLEPRRRINSHQKQQKEQQLLSGGSLLVFPILFFNPT